MPVLLSVTAVLGLLQGQCLCMLLTGCLAQGILLSPVYGAAVVGNTCCPSLQLPRHTCLVCAFCCALTTLTAWQALVSVSVIGTQDSLADEQLTAAVLKELSAWFGPDQTATWSHLKTYRCVGCCVG